MSRMKAIRAVSIGWGEEGVFDIFGWVWFLVWENRFFLASFVARGFKSQKFFFLLKVA